MKKKRLLGILLSITCDSSDAAIYYDEHATDNLTIELSGTNTVISNNNNGDGIKSKEKDITITGSGTLTVSGKKASTTNPAL